MRGFVWGFLIVGLSFAIGCQTAKPPTTQPVVVRPTPSVQLGKVHEPLPWRIVSFQKGKADKNLVKLAADLGFNGVQLQIEGSTLDGIKDLVEREKKEHLIDYCHSLGMKVTIWVHELSDVPQPYMPEWLGPVTVDNSAIWELLDKRYEWVLKEALPNVDGLCLTVVETQIRATDSAVMVKLVGLLQDKCTKYNKELQVRTFVWYPREFNSVMSAINQLPQSTVIMSKCVPQDWQLRGIDAAEIGAVGKRPQIEELDIGGEYYLKDRVANGMVDLLKRQFDYGVAHGIKGICVRVDRDDTNVLNQPNEVNLWALAYLAGGVSDNTDEIWHDWATNRFGAPAADGVVKALKTSGDVVSEMLSMGPFSFGDTRKFPYLGDEDFMGPLHQNWWWDQKYVPLKDKIERGDLEFTRQMAADKASAILQADTALDNLKLVKDKLAPQDYEILHTKLLTNRVQSGFRAPMALALMDYRRLIYSTDEQERVEANEQLKKDLAAVRDAGMKDYKKPKKIEWLGRKWDVNVPEDYNRDQIFYWAYAMDLLRQGIDPRTLKLGRRTEGWLPATKFVPVETPTTKSASGNEGD